MRPVTSAVIAGGLGATLMCLLDPVQGARRRALARDRARHIGRKTLRFAHAAGIDLRNRVSGLSARVRRTHGDEIPDGEVVLQHVRASLGRIVSHPGAVHVMVVGNLVRLDGAILARELNPLLSAIRRIDGVVRVDNRLMVRSSGEAVPGLQGSGTAPRHRIRHTLRAPGVQATAIVATVLGIATVILSRRAARPAQGNLELPFGGA